MVNDFRIIKGIGLAFLFIQTAGILLCWTLIGWASVKADADDDTLGLYTACLFILAIYFAIFWLINLLLIKKMKGNYRIAYLILAVIFILSIVPLVAGFFYFFLR